MGISNSQRQLVCRNLAYLSNAPLVIPSSFCHAITITFLDLADLCLLNEPSVLSHQILGSLGGLYAN